MAGTKLTSVAVALPLLMLFVVAAPPAHGQRLETMFIPLTPCRVVDSRIGLGVEGPLAPGVVNSIVFNNRCGVPALSFNGSGAVNRATAVAINVIAVTPAGFGHLTAWPSNQAMPTASIINYSPGQNLANGVIVPMCQRACPDGDINFVAAVSSVHLVVDVTGFYLKPVHPATRRHGAGPGQESFLCVNNLVGVRFGLSSLMAHQGEADRLCPAGTWLCSSGEVGEAGCDTSREDANCDARSCTGSCIDDPADSHRGWTDTAVFGPFNQFLTINEAGVDSGTAVCEMRPAWCCSPN